MLRWWQLYWPRRSDRFEESAAVCGLVIGVDAVLLGRPYVYGLALGSREDVEAVVENFLADLDLTVALAGVTDVENWTGPCCRSDRSR